MAEDKVLVDQLKISYNAAFSEHPDVLEDILTFAHYFEPCDNPDPHQMAIQNGRRDLALYILQRMGIKPSTFMKTFTG